MLPDGRPRLGRPLGSGFLSHVRYGSLADIRQVRAMSALPPTTDVGRRSFKSAFGCRFMSYAERCLRSALRSKAGPYVECVASAI